MHIFSDENSGLITLGEDFIYLEIVAVQKKERNSVERLKLTLQLPVHMIILWACSFGYLIEHSHLLIQVTYIVKRRWFLQALHYYN